MEARNARLLAARQQLDADAAVTDNPEMDEKTIEKIKEIEEGEMQASLKHIDKKFTEKGQVYYAETVDEEIPEQVNWWAKFALCLVRQMDRQNKYVTKISLQVNSQHLKDILRTTIADYPGVSFQTQAVTIDAPYHSLFHYRHEISSVRKDLTDEEAIAHLDLLIKFINETFKDTIADTENHLEQGLVTYANLWTIFRPGSILYGQILGQPRAFILNSYAYSCQPPALQLNVNFVDFDGSTFGRRHTQLEIDAFSGAQKIRGFGAYPLSMHADELAMKKRLTDRGRQFESLAGMHFRYYKGIGISYDAQRYSIDGRIVIDTKTYHRLNANYAFGVAAFPSSEDADNVNGAKRRRIVGEIEDASKELSDIADREILELDILTDEHCVLANAMVRGYSFSEKRWCDFFIDKCEDIVWNPQCFDQLVLPAAQKDLVQALVANHVRQAGAFDDIVKGKGKGLILVLHGPPGVGKTLTAETVAEYSRRPLFPVSSGDLGVTPDTLDERLSRILDMASTWRAVLLIDEADVFLERRSLHDMARNGLVGIFLRVLEYYEGILFLTSNRVATFDDAFKSRIHVPLKYAELTPASRRAIWENFLGRKGADGDAEVHIDEDGYDRLARTPINGRQIKNVIRTAKSLAQFHGQKLDVEKLEQVIQIQLDFERDLDGFGEEERQGVKKMSNGVTNGETNGIANGH